MSQTGTSMKQQKYNANLTRVDIAYQNQSGVWMSLDLRGPQTCSQETYRR
jgi:hypothetical protein